MLSPDLSPPFSVLRLAWLRLATRGTNMRGPFRIVGFALYFAIFTLALIAPAFGQPEGFQRVSGKYVDVITDLPLDEELKSLPLVFEKAMPLWCAVFGVDPKEVADWHGEVFIMLDKQRFDRAGYIPGAVPDFPYGFQYGDQMWVVEQQSTYYRRHLVLHEGTHWFMNRYFGSSGPPWLMEGMAEWLGTHQWDPGTETLEMGIIPSNKDSFPYWGRVKRIQEQLAAGTAPSLESILRYGPTAHRSVDAYAWSWAAVVFLAHHPDTQSAFQEMLEGPMRADSALSRELFDKLKERWPAIRAQWRVLATDLDYDYEPIIGMLRISETPQPIAKSLVTLEVQSNQTWQASGFYVRQGQQITIEATGRFKVKQIPQVWPSEANGITLEYFRGQPLGKLLLRVVAPERTESDTTVPVDTIAVGSQLDWKATYTGELHFQINEPIKDLADNEGQISVRITER